MPWWSGDSSDLEEYLIGLFPILKTDHGRLYVNPERRVYEQLLSEADVFVGMSEYESFGISYLSSSRVARSESIWIGPGVGRCC